MVIKRVTKELIIDMKKHCENTLVCKDKSGVCKYKEHCINYIDGGKYRFTPRDTEINLLLKHFTLCKTDKKHNQNFINSLRVHTSEHPSSSYWYRLVNYYCRHRNFKMCEEWLDFQDFADWWDRVNPENLSPRLIQSSKIINSETIVFIKR